MGTAAANFRLLAYKNFDLLDTAAIGLCIPDSCRPRQFGVAIEELLSSLSSNDISRLWEKDLLGLLWSHYRNAEHQYDVDTAVIRMVEAAALYYELVVGAQLQIAQLIDEVCAAADIEAALLKGSAASVNLYQNSYERFFHDVDVLSDKRQAVRLYEALQAAGLKTEQDSEIDLHGILAAKENYELPPLRLSCTIPLSDREISTLSHCPTSRFRNLVSINGSEAEISATVEIHYSLEPSGQLASRFTSSPLTGFQRLRRLTVEDTLVYTCYKFYTDTVISKKRFGIKLLSDALRVLETYKHEIDFQNLCSTISSNSLGTPTSYVLFHAINSFSVRLQEATVSPCFEKFGDGLDFGDFIPHLSSIQTPQILRPLLEDIQ